MTIQDDFYEIGRAGNAAVKAASDRVVGWLAFPLACITPGDALSWQDIKKASAACVAENWSMAAIYKCRANRARAIIYGKNLFHFRMPTTRKRS